MGPGPLSGGGDGRSLAQVRGDGASEEGRIAEGFSEEDGHSLGGSWRVPQSLSGKAQLPCFQEISAASQAGIGTLWFQMWRDALRSPPRGQAHLQMPPLRPYPRALSPDRQGPGQARPPPTARRSPGQSGPQGGGGWGGPDANLGRVSLLPTEMQGQAECLSHLRDEPVARSEAAGDRGLG